MAKSTIKDVAELAGVSKATVSYVLNDVKGKYSESTKEKVMKVIKELDYELDYTAKTLSTGRSYMVGVLLPTYEDGDILEDNPFFLEFFNGMESYLRNEKNSLYDLVITGVDINNMTAQKWVRKRNIDALVVIGLQSENFFKELKNLEIPVLLLDNYGEGSEEFNRIYIEDEEGAYKGTKYLLENGHRDIIFVNGGINLSCVEKKRFIGYKRALNEYGIDVNEDYIIETIISYENGKNISTDIIERDEVTGIFASSDIVSLGIIKGLKEMGYVVPDDYSIVGFDNIKVAEFMNPGLSTVSQNISGKGKKAAEILIDILDKKMENGVSYIMKTKLIERSSVRII